MEGAELETAANEEEKEVTEGQVDEEYKEVAKDILQKLQDQEKKELLEFI